MNSSLAALRDKNISSRQKGHEVERLIRNFYLSRREIARLSNISITTICSYLLIKNLDRKVMKLINNKEISIGTCERIARRVSGKKSQYVVVCEVIMNGLKGKALDEYIFKRANELNAKEVSAKKCKRHLAKPLISLIEGFNVSIMHFTEMPKESFDAISDNEKALIEEGLSKTIAHLKSLTDKFDEI